MKNKKNPLSSTQCSVSMVNENGGENILITLQIDSAHSVCARLRCQRLLPVCRFQKSPEFNTILRPKRSVLCRELLTNKVKFCQKEIYLFCKKCDKNHTTFDFVVCNSFLYNILKRIVICKRHSIDKKHISDVRIIKSAL